MANKKDETVQKRENVDEPHNDNTPFYRCTFSDVTLMRSLLGVCKQKFKIRHVVSRQKVWNHHTLCIFLTFCATWTDASSKGR